MKALVLEEPGNLRFHSAWADPVGPSDWALVRIRASGICGSDLPRIMQTGAYHHPMIPGHECAGTIVRGGRSGLPCGTPVAILPIIPCKQCEGCKVSPFHCKAYDFIGSRRDGGFAEFCLVPSENLLTLPEGLPLDEGAFVEPLSVALHVLRQSGMTPGARALVLGAGTIGLLIAQWASILGAAEVVAADIREESLDVARACGLTKAVDSRSQEFESMGEFDVVFEAAGANAALLAGMGKLAPRGVLAVVGRDVRDTVIPVSVFETFMRREAQLCGCWGYDLRQDREFLQKTLAGGRLKIWPMITATIPLDDGPAVISGMWNKDRFFCKILFNP
ncbi:MAG: alcohol dehydrogenase catalytic domain-containing protein [bacterium]|nr:alcohol dehydrogenase catalytic domain-containing protein [Candidatus Sumerlaeota bacterium]